MDIFSGRHVYENLPVHNKYPSERGSMENDDRFPITGAAKSGTLWTGGFRGHVTPGKSFAVQSSEVPSPWFFSLSDRILARFQDQCLELLLLKI